MQKNDWLTIARQAEEAEHEHLHKSKEYALADAPALAGSEFQHFKERQRSKRYAVRQIG